MICGVGCEIERIEAMIRHAIWSSGMTGLVVGVSGGVDSGVAAALCARAVEPRRVLGLILPSTVTSDADVGDARLLCESIGIPGRVVSIGPMVEAFMTMPGFEEDPLLIGNIMARVRMTVLYYHANSMRRLVCGTSNRSEYMVGYCTKWGDAAADIQPLLHLYKTEVRELAEELGIPEPIRKKPPSAGLWPGQRDEAELGMDYEELDATLMALEEKGWRAETPAEEKVAGMVRASMHKRMPPPHLSTTSRKGPGSSPEH
ncbi:MAG: NAD+ synthase [Methanomicrobiaceae archaeon]|nr:NAD+ synthase [Methanomicrobiaceae archaeon]